MKRSKQLLLLLAVVLLGINVASAQSKGRTATRKATTKTAAAAPASGAKALWINFNGGEDVKSIACDDKHVYVTMNWTRRMVIIEKATGKLSQIKRDNEIFSVVVANNKCYYTVVGEGLFSYDPVTGESTGPLFGIDQFSANIGTDLAVSPDGNYLLCKESVVDLRTGEVDYTFRGGRITAVNNVGGAYISLPDPFYCYPETGDYYISRSDVVHGIYPDALTGNTFWCCEEGVGYTEMVPPANSGIKKVTIPGIETQYIPLNITRADDGNLVLTTTQGIIFGGKTLEDKAVLVERLKTGLKDQYGSELSLNYFNGVVTPDGMGNLVFGSPGYAYVCIYNPDGLKGYTELKGKAVRF